MIDLIKNLIFPSIGLCLICKEEDKTGKHICINCKENLEIVNGEIELYSPYIENAYYSVFYNKFIREVIKDYKYNGKNYLYKTLAELMLDTISIYDLKIDNIMYIPMHRRKQAIRGYNQAGLLALHISKSLSIPIIEDNLIKYKSTKVQSHSDKYERSKNLIDSFSIKKPFEIRDKNILLVDDIITTGATIEEASKVLKKNGAGKITGLAITSSKTT